MDIGLLSAITAPTITPNETGLPGTATAKGMVGGLVIYGLIFCIIGVILSAGMWAIGSFSSNYTQSVNGKRGFLVCAGAAVAIGAARFLVDWFAKKGDSTAS
jgi:hypothetical protein